MLPVPKDAERHWDVNLILFQLHTALGAWVRPRVGALLRFLVWRGDIGLSVQSIGREDDKLSDPCAVGRAR